MGLSKVDLLVDARARLGECALWCDRRRALYWTDIEGATLSRRDEADGASRQWQLPERLGSFALCDDPFLKQVMLVEPTITDEPVAA